MMCIFGSPPTVNSRGDEMSGHDVALLQGDTVKGGIMKTFIDPTGIGLKLTPQQRGEMLYNWLTGGGPPKLVNPSKIFAEKESMAPVEEKASAGQGINSLFGIGKVVGDMLPVSPMVGGPIADIGPPKMVEPINQSPMQPGVPYSAKPVGGK
jgi:hypothetical protein